jgi:uncharacterized LabA/DUF88 family protein
MGLLGGSNVIPDINYLFIDGGYFRDKVTYLSQRYLRSDPIPIDPYKLCKGFKKTFYYDAPPPKKKNESEPDYRTRLEEQDRYHNQLRSVSGCHVIKGSISSSGSRARQKQVDVAIAVDMLTHSYRRNMNRATFLTGDLDFKPLVDALVYDGMQVTLWCEENSTNRELVYSADDKKLFDIINLIEISTDLYQAQFAPFQHYLGQKRNRSLNPVKSGKTRDGNQAELHSDGGHHELIIFYDSGREKGLSHPNLNLLKQFFKDECVDEWTWKQM